MINNVFARVYNHRNLFVFMILFLVLSSPKKVNASEIIASADTISKIANGVNNVTDAGYTSFGYFPVPLSSEKHQLPIAEKLNVNSSDLFDVSNDDITISPLTNDQKSALEDPIYNSVGAEMDLNEVFIGLFDNGFFTGSFFCDSSGDLLYTDDSSQVAFLDVKHGGSVINSQQWTDAYTSLGEDILLSSYVYALNGGTPSNNAFQLCWGQWQGGQARNIWSLYINDQYSIGNTVPYQATNNQRIYRWVTNDLSNFNYKNFIGTDNSKYSVVSFNSNYNGYYYKYLVTFAQSSDFTNASPNNTISNWLVGNNTDYNFFAKVNYTYNSSKLTSNQIAFKPLSMDNARGKIDIGSAYGADALSEYVGSITDAVGTYNPSYNGQNAISTSNYPLIYNISINVPDSVTPDLAIGNPALTYDPALEMSNEAIIGSFSNLQIPFLSGLQHRFPFCIPWDIRDALTLMKFEPLPPAWDFNWKITVLGETYTYHCVGDLSDFNELALIFRRLILVSVIIGVAFWSYRIFF